MFLEEVIFPSDTSSCILDTPRLEYLSLKDSNFKSFNVISMSDCAEVDTDVDKYLDSPRDALICVNLKFFGRRKSP
ncbi:unnamed protein product [Microthlaspi erraticum]|uniref:FBD domain-containing protein n=1 Tax=Microthlaspi erraticum TaxID=1685480 RepID=A0A6D2KIS7_9BRAS|nr:unnamed protein product [Microthlaspi erraticum]